MSFRNDSLLRLFFFRLLQSAYRSVRTGLYQVQRILGRFFGSKVIFVLAESISEDEKNEVATRMRYYLPEFPKQKIRRVRRWPLRALLSLDPILLFGRPSRHARSLQVLLHNVFSIDYRSDPQDGWEWVRLVNLWYRHRPPVHLARVAFTRRVEELKKQKLDKSYIFGTGPSLEKAIDRDWSDGYRIVSNTIVRDPVLWKHLDPHFVVAADAIYHFGHTSFAKTFRRDLLARLSETQTLFVYPDFFDPIVRREFIRCSAQLIPISRGHHDDIAVDLTRCFNLPNLGNVLPLLLLPLGCTLAKTVCLWGFDGRAPSDKLFWSNSNKHTYQELIPELQKAHPGFFRHYVPKEDPTKYVREYHGDVLDGRMSAAEKAGYRFIMLHPSWTPALNKRYLDDRRSKQIFNQRPPRGAADHGSAPVQP
jgi:hypothetical protein